MSKSGFNKSFKDGTGGLRAGGNNATQGFRSAERKVVAASVWDDSVPVGYWNFEDGSGTTLSDVSSAGNNLDGTLKGVSSDYPDWKTDNKVRGNSSLLFEDGSGQLVHMADNSVLDFNPDDDFSLSVWFKRVTTLSSLAVLIGKMTNNAVGLEVDWTGYTVYLDSGVTPYFLLRESASSELRVYYNAVLNNTNWHNLVVTYNGTGGDAANLAAVKMYVDGSAVTVTQSTDTLNDDDLTTTSTDFAIGALSKGTGNGLYFFDGHIDECAVWSKTLSADEVTDVYNSGDGNDLTDGIPKS